MFQVSGNTYQYETLSVYYTHKHFSFTKFVNSNKQPQTIKLVNICLCPYLHPLHCVPIVDAEGKNLVAVFDVSSELFDCTEPSRTSSCHASDMVYQCTNWHLCLEGHKC